MLKNISIFAVVILALVSSGCLITATANAPRTAVRAHEPSAFMVADDSDLLVVPGTYVYWLNGQDNVFFYGGVWWRQWEGNWYRADASSGHWGRVEMGSVPRPVTHLPSNWRMKNNEAPHVNWRSARTQWRAWEKDRYWEKHRWRREAPSRR